MRPEYGLEPGSKHIDQHSLTQSGRTAPASRRFRAGVVAVALFVAITAVRPWGAGPAPSPEVVSPRTVRPEAVARPTPAERLYLVAIHDSCPEDGWLVVVDDLTVTSPTRSWIVAESSTAAAAPGDASIPFTRVVSPEIRTLGFCSPPEAAATAWRGTLWHAAADASGAVRWEASAQYTLSSGRMSALLAGPDAPAASATAATEPDRATATGWTTGRYVFEAAGSDRTVWIGVDLVAGS